MLRALAQRTHTSAVARALILGLACFAGAEVGHFLAPMTVEQVFATFWPPAGLLLAALVLTEFRAWALQLAAACAGNLASNLLHGQGLAAGIGFCSANAAEACLGAWLLRHFGEAPFNLSRVRAVLHLACLPALRGQAALGVVSLSVLILAAAVSERRQAERQKIRLIGELEQALAEIKTLRGLIPLCAWCKKVRDDAGFWQRFEDYLGAHTDAVVTHGICPDCLDQQLASRSVRT